MLESDSKNLINKMQSLENEISFIEKEIRSIKSAIVPLHSPTDVEIKKAITQLKRKIESGELENIKQILQHYISKIIVDDKHVYIQYDDSM